MDEERDLQVLMSKDLKFSKQFLLSKSKANLKLDIINRGVLYKFAGKINIKLYISYAIYHIQFFTPTNVKDADMYWRGS